MHTRATDHLNRDCAEGASRLKGSLVMRSNEIRIVIFIVVNVDLYSAGRRKESGSLFTSIHVLYIEQQFTLFHGKASALKRSFTRFSPPFRFVPIPTHTAIFGYTDEDRTEH